MKRIVALFLMLVAAGAYAQSKEPVAPGKDPPSQSKEQSSSWSSLLEKLRMKIERLTPQKNLGAVTAVGGVRGAEVQAADVYWKGEAKSQAQAIDENELAAFKKGVSLVESDQTESARAAFNDFLKTYPNSILKADAAEVLQNLPTQTQPQ